MSVIRKAPCPMCGDLLPDQGLVLFVDTADGELFAKCNRCDTCMPCNERLAERLIEVCDDVPRSSPRSRHRPRPCRR